MTSARFKQCLWLVAPAITAILVLISPLRVGGNDTLPGSLGGMAFHCSAVTRLDTIGAIHDLAARDAPLPYWMQRDQDGGIVSTWGPGAQMLASLGFIDIGPGDALSAAEVRARARYVAALWLAIAIGVVAWWLRQRLDPVHAAAAGVVIATCFAAGPTLGQAIWQATVAVVPLLAGLVIAMRPEGRLRLLGPGALLLAVLLRPPIFPLALGLGVHWLLARPRWRPGQLAIAAGVAGLLATPMLAWNIVHGGTPLPLGQWHANGLATDAVLQVGARPVAQGVAGLLVSPARGLVWFAPLALIGVVVAWRSQLRVVAVACVAQVVFAAMFFNWWGGACFGPRLLSEVALVSSCVALAHVDTCGRAMRWAVVVAAAWTCVVGLFGMFRWDPSQWEARHPDTASALWNVVESPLPALARDPLPMKDWLDRYDYRCLDVGVETTRR